MLESFNWGTAISFLAKTWLGNSCDISSELTQISILRLDICLEDMKDKFGF